MIQLKKYLIFQQSCFPQWQPLWAFRILCRFSNSSLPQQLQWKWNMF